MRISDWSSDVCSSDLRADNSDDGAARLQRQVAASLEPPRDEQQQAPAARCRRAQPADPSQMTQAPREPPAEHYPRPERVTRDRLLQPLKEHRLSGGKPRGAESGRMYADGTATHPGQLR